MSRYIAGALAVILVVAGAWFYWRNAAPTNPAIDQSAQSQATTTAEGITCHGSTSYFVVVRDHINAGGQDILAKPKSTPTQTYPCEFTKAPGDIDLSTYEPTYFLALTGRYLLLDSGTAPPPRGLSVYDLSLGTTTYNDLYNRPVEVGDGAFTYWQPIATKPTAQNCPDLAVWHSQGLGAGLERHVTLNLATLALTDMGEVRCSARQ